MIGVDEVGRGCLAGPMLVVAARAKADLPSSLRDSKLMTRKQRAEAFEILLDCCVFGEGWVGAVEIDKYGLSKALRLGIKRALRAIDARIDELIIMDGKINYAPKKYKKVRNLVNADNLVPIVSAASIYAKVKRDNYMIKLSKKYPLYRFEKHVGYGTIEHRKAINAFGAVKLVHRLSYASFAKLTNQTL
jgi:ribonuclease HII